MSLKPFYKRKTKTQEILGHLSQVTEPGNWQKQDSNPGSLAAEPKFSNVPRSSKSGGRDRKNLASSGGGGYKHDVHLLSRHHPD